MLGGVIEEVPLLLEPQALGRVECARHEPNVVPLYVAVIRAPDQMIGSENLDHVVREWFEFHPISDAGITMQSLSRGFCEKCDVEYIVTRLDCDGEREP